MKKQMIASVIVIILLLGLNWYLFYRATSYDCDSCVIEFKSKMGSQQFGNLSDNIINITAVDLFVKYMEGECPVIWEDTQGYMLNG